jgi:thiamine monophosphate synthase
VGARDIDEVVKAGADGIAMISAILAAEDQEAAASEINDSVNDAISKYREGQEERS